MAKNFTGQDIPLECDFISFKEASGGFTFNYLQTNNRAFSWGCNTGYATLGQGTTAIGATLFTTPGEMCSEKPIGWKSISFGANHGHAIRCDGTLWSWGKNGSTGTYGYISGQLGCGAAVASCILQQISQDCWSQVSAGSRVGLGIKSDGSLWGWGMNETYSLGFGLINDYVQSPCRVGLLSNWKCVITNCCSTMAIKTDGTLWAWGSNSVGSLGLGDSTDRSSPVQVGTATNWSEVSFTCHALAVKTDGTLWTWGNNLCGELGNGVVGSKSGGTASVPTQIGTLTNWSKVSAGLNFSLAIKTDGTLWAWGRNTDGQLGLNSITNFCSPVQVGALSNWQKLPEKINFSPHAIKTDGTLWSWGVNIAGALGLGDSTNRSSPVQVGSFSDWTQISTSNCKAAGLRAAINT